MNIKNLNKLALWVPVLLSVLSATQLSAKVEDTVKESFSTTGAGLLTLDLQSSRVDIDTYDGSEVTIAVLRTMKRGDQDDFEKELEKVDLTFEQSGNEIRCTLKYEQENRPWRLFSGNKKRLNFATVVRIPKTFDVDTKTSGGSIDLKNLIGDAKLHTSGGRIEMDNVDGKVSAKTSGGGIEAKDCNGDVEMRTSGGSLKANNIAGSLFGRTSGGNISVQDVVGNADVSTSGGSISLGTVSGNLQASTSGGSINAKVSGQPSEICELKTSGGSIRIAVNPQAKMDIDASTSGGGVHSDLTLSNLKLKRSSLVGQLNGGGPKLKARTSGGSIHINSI